MRPDGDRPRHRLGPLRKLDVFHQRDRREAANCSNACRVRRSPGRRSRCRSGASASSSCRDDSQHRLGRRSARRSAPTRGRCPKRVEQRSAARAARCRREGRAGRRRHRDRGLRPAFICSRGRAALATPGRRAAARAPPSRRGCRRRRRSPRAARAQRLQRASVAAMPAASSSTGTMMESCRSGARTDSAPLLALRVVERPVVLEEADRRLAVSAVARGRPGASASSSAYFATTSFTDA